MRKVHLIGVFCIMFSIFNLVACSNNIFADHESSKGRLDFKPEYVDLIKNYTYGVYDEENAIFKDIEINDSKYHIGHEVEKSKLIDRGDYYELTNCEVRGDPHFDKNLGKDKNIGDWIEINGDNYQVKEIWKNENQEITSIRLAPNGSPYETDEVGISSGEDYSLIIGEDAAIYYQKDLYKGSLYFSKDAIVEYFPKNEKYTGSYRKATTFEDYIRMRSDNDYTMRGVYRLFYGGINMDENGLINVYKAYWIP